MMYDSDYSDSDNYYVDYYSDDDDDDDADNDDADNDDVDNDDVDDDDQSLTEEEIAAADAAASAAEQRRLQLITVLERKVGLSKRTKKKLMNSLKNFLSKLKMLSMKCYVLRTACRIL